MPPGRYERRRGCIGNGRHDKFWRTHWLACVTHLLATGRIDITAHGVASAVATMSNAKAEHEYPSQATIGEDCKRSASTVSNPTLSHTRQPRPVDGTM